MKKRYRIGATLNLELFLENENDAHKELYGILRKYVNQGDQLWVEVVLAKEAGGTHVSRTL